jgi:BirA family transcriptional regulator, biotin operon repressor / biotin---[acetyl-CoA-carboxylase] ligase
VTGPLIPFEHVPETGSTNADAMARIAAGEGRPLWLTTDAQTSGRGRSGRPWVSPRGNFYGSLIHPFSPVAGTASQLALVVAVALHEAIMVHLPVAAGPALLKWPNDVLIDGAKVSGILIESASVDTRLVAVIGIGVNLTTAPDALDRRVTSLAAQGAAVAPDVFRETLSATLLAAFEVWAEGARFDLIRSRWSARALPTGTAMTINTGDGLVAGAFAGLDADGALLLSCSDGHRRFTFGDVTVA